MRRTRIGLKGTYELAKSFLESKGFGERKRSRGRPPTYDTALILTLMVIQNLYAFSFRETLEFSRDVFGEIPALSTFYYRVKTMPTKFISEFTAFVGAKLNKRNGKDSF